MWHVCDEKHFWGEVTNFVSMIPFFILVELVYNYKYICISISIFYKEDCLSLSVSVSVSVCLSVSMHSHSFQDTKFKLLTQVKDFQEQVVDGLSILRYPSGLENKGLITQKA